MRSWWRFRLVRPARRELQVSASVVRLIVSSHDSYVDQPMAQLVRMGTLDEAILTDGAPEQLETPSKGSGIEMEDAGHCVALF